MKFHTYEGSKPKNGKPNKSKNIKIPTYPIKVETNVKISTKKTGDYRAKTK